MENFIKGFLILPEKFVTDFIAIANECIDNSMVIDFDIVCNWLDVRKDHLKKILVKEFENDIDYKIEKKKKQVYGTGLTTYYEIFITSNCFKELCIILRSEKAHEIKKYLTDMEKLIKQYKEEIRDDTRENINQILQERKIKNDIPMERNQPYERNKVIKNKKSKYDEGVIYVIRALNTDEILYKIGKTNNLDKRLAQHGDVVAHDIKPEFILFVSNINVVESCIKIIIKKYQCTKGKEIYKIDFNVLRE